MNMGMMLCMVFGVLFSLIILALVIGPNDFADQDSQRSTLDNRQIRTSCKPLGRIASSCFTENRCALVFPEATVLHGKVSFRPP